MTSEARDLDAQSSPVLLVSADAAELHAELSRGDQPCRLFLELDSSLATTEVPLAVIVDPEALGLDLESVFGAFRARWPAVPVVVLGNPRLDSAVAALRAGAAGYHDRTAPIAELKASLANVLENRALIERLGSPPLEGRDFPDLLGESSAIEGLRARLRQAASSEVTTLILGETGSGKELVARLIHSQSARGAGPIVVVNCAAIPDSLADSELFGHMKGAFTGAQSAYSGLVRAADGGTLFLDDIGALSLDTQAKLLRTLQQKSVRPVGSSAEIPVDFRVLASSTLELEALVRIGRFREDLYYRLAVLEIHVPPLRERELDVMLLAEKFLAEASARSEKTIRGITPAVARAFLSYRWPGNVRELRNSIDYAISVARYDHLTEGDLPQAVRAHPAVEPAKSEDVRWETIERHHIETVLRSVNGNRAHAARLLGIDRKTLHRKLERLSIDIPPAGLRRTRSDAGAQSKRYRFIFR